MDFSRHLISLLVHHSGKKTNEEIPNFKIHSKAQGP